MTTALREFEDLADKRFHVDPRFHLVWINGPLRLERGTRSFASSLLRAGVVTLGDLHEKTVLEIVTIAARGSASGGLTTRRNFNKVLSYLPDDKITLG